MNQFCGTTCCWRPPLPFQQHWPPIHSLQGDLGEAPMDIDSADESPQNGNQQHTDPGNIPLPKEFVAKPANCGDIFCFWPCSCTYISSPPPTQIPSTWPAFPGPPTGTYSSKYSPQLALFGFPIIFHLKIFFPISIEMQKWFTTKWRGAAGVLVLCVLRAKCLLSGHWHEKIWWSVLKAHYLDSFWMFPL